MFYSISVYFCYCCTNYSRGAKHNVERHTTNIIKQCDFDLKGFNFVLGKFLIHNFDTARIEKASVFITRENWRQIRKGHACRLKLFAMFERSYGTKPYYYGVIATVPQSPVIVSSSHLSQQCQGKVCEVSAAIEINQ